MVTCYKAVCTCVMELIESTSEAIFCQKEITFLVTSCIQKGNRLVDGHCFGHVQSETVDECRV